MQEAAGERLADAEDQLDRLRRLERADQAGQHAQHAALGAARHEARAAAAPDTGSGSTGRPWSRTPTPALEAEDAAVDVRLAEQHARVVHEIARRKVVRAVDDDVVRAEEIERVGRGERDLVRHDRDLGVDRVQPIPRRRELRAADVRRAVQDLALQVAEVDDVEVDEAERADAGGREVHRDGRAEAAGADAEHLRGLQLALPLDADLRHDQVPAVALHFVVGQLGQRRTSAAAGAPPATDGMMLTVSPGDTGVCSFCR